MPGVTTRVTYGGSNFAPTAAGVYAVVATVDYSPNYMGTASGTLTIVKGNAVVTLTGLSSSYNGSPHTATASTVPAALGVSITYNGSSVPPTQAGSYAVVAAVNEANYQGTALGTLVIGKASAPVAVTNLNPVYNGTGKPAGATTSPAGLNVTFTYNGGTALPVAAGTYAVVATVADNNYAGTGIGTMVIAKATPVVSWGNPAPMTFGGALGNLQLNAAASVAGTFVYSPAAGTVLPIGAGQLAVSFTPADSLNYNVTAGGVSLSVVPGPVVDGANLIVTRTMTRDASNNILVRLTLANAGNTAAGNVVVTNVAIGTAKAALLPQSFGTIPSGGIVTRTLTIPGPVGAAGSAGMLSVSGTFTGGTVVANARITLP